jgi:hypothetical protein
VADVEEAAAKAGVEEQDLRREAAMFMREKSESHFGGK